MFFGVRGTSDRAWKNHSAEMIFAIGRFSAEPENIPQNHSERKTFYWSKIISAGMIYWPKNVFLGSECFFGLKSFQLQKSFREER